MESTYNWLMRLAENKSDPPISGGLGGSRPVAAPTNGLGRAYRDFTGGANNSIASTLGAPVDLVNRYTGNVPNAFMGSDWIRNKMNSLGIGTEGRGAAGFTGGLLGSMAIPGTGLLNAIDTSAQIAQARTPTDMLLAAGGGLLGEAASAFTKPKTLLDMTAYHGSPHNFDEFSLSKIGTGEGAQAYGHGLYFAESPEVAKSYQTALSAERGFSFGGKSGLTRAEVQDMVNAKYGAKYLDGVIRPSGVADSFMDDMVTGLSRADGAYPRQYKPGSERAKVYDELRGQITHADPGSLYHVDIPDSAIEKMLDWDKPLSEQPKLKSAVQKALADYHDLYGDDPQIRNAYKDAIGSLSKGEMTGEGAYKSLVRVTGSPEMASRVLSSEYGIPGIRYLDGGSRGSGTGTRNFVVFDDKLVKVLKKE